jgi:hypothetical protein
MRRKRYLLVAGVEGLAVGRFVLFEKKENQL